jgi:hypothetical protein
MNFKNYDIVRIRKPFTLEVNGESISFPSNIEGVIVESFDDEYLIEFTYASSEPLYILIKSDDIVKVWEAPQ